MVPSTLRAESRPSKAEACASEIRDPHGNLMRRTTLERAVAIVAEGHGRFVGKKQIHVTLNRSLDTPSSVAWCGGSNTTQRIRNDDGQLIAPGGPNGSGQGLEHKPLPLD